MPPRRCALRQTAAFAQAARDAAFWLAQPVLYTAAFAALVVMLAGLLFAGLLTDDDAPAGPYFE